MAIRPEDITVVGRVVFLIFIRDLALILGVAIVVDSTLVLRLLSIINSTIVLTFTWVIDSTIVLAFTWVIDSAILVDSTILVDSAVMVVLARNWNNIDLRAGHALGLRTSVVLNIEKHTSSWL